VWQEKCNLIFEYNTVKPDVSIVFSSGRITHRNNYRYMKGQYSCDFDGNGKVLEHAFFPADTNKCREIYLDSSESNCCRPK
jgi:hypothetical protein